MDRLTAAKPRLADQSAAGLIDSFLCFLRLFAAIQIPAGRSAARPTRPPKPLPSPAWPPCGIRGSDAR